MRMPRWALLGLVAMLTLGCSISGPAFREVPVPSSGSLLYVYRPAGLVASGQQPVLRINGTRISKILNGGYTVVSLEPGRHKLSLHAAGALQPESSKPFMSRSFEVKPGEALYFSYAKVYKGGDLVFETKDELKFESAEEALGEIQKTKYIGNEHGKTVPALLGAIGA